MLLVYGILTETSISKLFIAGIVPGLIAVGLYMLTILVVTRIRPAWGPARGAASWGERGRSAGEGLAGDRAVLIVMGGIYGGSLHTDGGGRDRRLRGHSCFALCARGAELERAGRDAGGNPR